MLDKIRSAWLAAIVVMSLGSHASAAERARVGIEVDPLPFVNHGYSVHLLLKPAPRWRFTFGVFGYRFEPKGDNEGFTTRVDAIEGSAGYYPLSKHGRGFFAALYVFEQRYRYRYEGISGEARRHWLTPAPAVGYQLLPWDQGPYLTAWAALGVPVARTGETDVGNKSYDEPSIVPVLAVHLGGELEVF
jgi:hypothetical protein